MKVDGQYAAAAANITGVNDPDLVDSAVTATNMASRTTSSPSTKRILEVKLLIILAIHSFNPTHTALMLVMRMTSAGMRRMIWVTTRTASSVP